MNPAYNCDPKVFEGSSYNGHKLQALFRPWEKDYKMEFSIMFNLRNTADVDYIGHYKFKDINIELFHYKNSLHSVMNLAHQKAM
jgi:hypothetical protein